MSRVKTLQSLFKRYRRPGDIVFAVVVFAFTLLLLSQLFEQTAYQSRGKFVAQPRFWPAVSLIGMTGFAAFHLIGSALSERIYGRWGAIWNWIKSVEYAVWFIAYAASVPYAGYLPTTVIFAVLLSLRAGYRSGKMIGIAVVCSIAVVLLFKTILKVNLPAGQIYNALPDGLRQIMLTYF
ncbi:tripartite tricarboxylate transporter TctB family protein [Sulfitobacter sp. M57]|uniref:tripartite tricarboxylate transporter TctB family protein n=1 Tax=unclassified Sulfitobacter TaxID=196795 RepID=UPI0023E2CD68|nr:MULTISPECIES: tripartite tricarboxylate transporter TctB family protein [unclassified Sulfitobacter]MDF3413027.1 tripartite tricarboxylate transporter TctB family protein [Sulfitobacter sp. KE5]MDF3421689.1 tripartite tricarboxylate transporter TctB family protein [Sulfitobacter sp. KE43]MDF3431576.1 tripartite tricarboxylate transporter TctB family protein [Sulfitobacter sp. KE42]MDF3457217.1 tripartite tricarboxylate transporter TctB family protein [Sulfitobacter sp. S74]MDF3461120.1 trip